MSVLENVLAGQAKFEPIIRSPKPFKRLDFSAGNADLLKRDLSETAVFSSYVFNEMLEKSSYIGIGGYNEDRIIYRHRKHFAQDLANPRSIHLGADIWSEAGEPVFAPLDATVHSFAFNDHYGDYGPTIILEHTLNGVTFFTLYGHLALSSLDNLVQGKVIEAGTSFASIGPSPQNGDWPPHLHFQLISDMGSYSGDFPGVSSVLEKERYLAICPDPNLILRISENS